MTLIRQTRQIFFAHPFSARQALITSGLLVPYVFGRASDDATILEEMAVAQPTTNESSDESASGTGAEGPYVGTLEVATPDGEQDYTARVPTMAALTDNAFRRGIEVGAVAFGHDGAVFVRGAHSPTLTKFGVDSTGAFVEGATLSFAGPGATRIGRVACMSCRARRLSKKASLTYLADLNVPNTSRIERTGKPRAIMGTVAQSIGSLVLCVAITSLAASGCTEADGAGVSDEAEGSQPAVVIGNRVCTPDRCSMYLGAFPEVPRGELDRATMLEFGDLVYLTSFEGRVYSYDRESARLTKFVITGDFRLEPAGTLSFEAFGATGSPAYTQVASASRAFSYLRSAQTIVVWNPSTMEVEREIPTPEIVRDGVAPDLNPPVLAAGRVQWPVKWVDYDSLRFDRHAAVLSIDTETLAVEILEDPRAAVTSVLHATGDGDTLVLSDNYSGFLNLFGEAAGTTSPEAVLRVRAGRDFDSAYRVDLRAATGSPAVYGGWFLGDNSMLLRVWDPDVDPSSVLTDPDDYWSAEEYVSMVVVDLMSGTAERFDGLPRGGAGSTGDPTQVDGKVYISVYRDVGGGNRTELFAVTTLGAEPAFSTLGDVLFMGRAR